MSPDLRLVTFLVRIFYFLYLGIFWCGVYKFYFMSYLKVSILYNIRDCIICLYKEVCMRKNRGGVGHRTLHSRFEEG